MNEAVMVSGVVMFGSMGAIVVLGVVGGLLLKWIDGRMKRQDGH